VVEPGGGHGAASSRAKHRMVTYDGHAVTVALAKDWPPDALTWTPKAALDSHPAPR